MHRSRVDSSCPVRRRRALSVCGSPCDGCSGCGNLGGGRVDEIYRPYIDGEKELAEINAAYAASRGLVK